MTPEEKLKILGASAKYDVSCCGGSQRQARNVPGLYYASGSNGKVIPILKTLFTNKCKNNCMYCANRISQDMPRTSFTPQELAEVFMQIYDKHFVEGLFLSSGIDGSADQTMGKMIKTAEILRYKHHFRGYLHLKVLPGVHPSTIKRAAQLTTRLSVNIEAPTPQRLSRIAKDKNFMQEIINAMELIKKETENRESKAPQTTQFIVGAAEETDREIVTTMDWLRRTKGLHRTYFSAFTPTSTLTPTYNYVKSIIRKNRLYQTEFLHRAYGFSLAETYFSNKGGLPTHIDPKLNYALHNLDKFPIEINKASLYQLLRIPGIGKITARKIIEIRKEGRFTCLSEIRKLGGTIKRAAPFILINGKKQGELKNLALSEQLSLAI